MSKIEIVSYNSDWPNWFHQAKHLLQEAIGDLAVSIDHIGSTAVPGLGSKNRIDIQITVGVAITNEFKKLIDEKLIECGFSETRHECDHRPPTDTSPDCNWTKLYLTGTHAHLKFRTNIHIRARGMANQIYPLLFRDYLCSNTQARDAYYNLKKSLAEYLGDNSEAYTNVKDPVCDLIMISAREWASRTDWQSK